MDENDTITKHLNVYNTRVSHITSVGIKIAEEDKYITLLCYFPDSQDNLIVPIGSSRQATLKFDEIVASLLLEEMRRKAMVSHTMDALSVKGRP